MPGTAGTFDTMQDRNQVYTIAGISGTLGPTYGTAEPRPLTVGENGYLNVNAAAANSTGGTLDLLKAGTITRLEGGSIAVTAGTVVVTSGTQQTLGTVGTLQAGTITRLEGGTLGLITTVSNLSAGSVAVTAGTVIVTNGTIGAGTLAVSAGTVGGKAASGAAAVANPVLIAGTDAGGTVYSLLVDTKGQQFISAGTITNSGTTTGVGTVSGVAVVTSLSAGTITRLEGGTLGILSQGSINVTAGTMVMTVGTVGGKAASGAAAVANPVLVAGTDAGGTVYSLLTDTKGQQFISAGTITKLEQGSINVTAGTITAGSIVVTVGTIAAGTVAVSAGTITAGTINAGTVRINPNPTTQTMPFGTTTTGTIGTLVAAPSAGSAILIDSLDVSLHNGTADVVVSYGLVTTGNGVVTRGNFVAGGGISKNPTYPIGGSITGSALTYNILGGSGTVSYSLAYRIAVP